MLTDCPECGTQVVAGDDCPLCGTPTPAPSDSAPAPPPAEAPAKPVRNAAPPKDPGASRPMDTVARYANQWEVIYDRIRAAVAPKYEVTGILGYGGMAGVYLADEPRLARKVAIKVMSPGLMVDPQLVERFNQEARTIAQFNHPNIVTIYEVDERDSLHYFTMTYVPGRTLGQVMAGTEGPLPIPVVRAWLYQIGDALAYAHHHGVIHRDVKPGNVLLDQRGNALVTDFGIAKVTDEPGLTRTGMLVGTPAYMSPEQCSSGKVEGASDQYSLGAVAYQMLTGQPPFAGPTLAVLQAHVGQEPRPIRELRPDCPDDLVAAVQRMLEKQPEDRWPTLSAAVAGAGASAPSFDGPVRQQIELLAVRAATIRVEPWFDVVREGSTETLTATVLDARGRALEARKVEWRTGDELIASVTNGRLRAVSPGSTAIDVVSDGALTTLSITVETDPVPAIEVEPTQASVTAGARIPLDAIVTDWDGARLDERAVLWSSSDSTIATVSPEGVVEGVRPGEALVTASTGGKAATVTLTVTSTPVATPAAPADPDAAATLVPGSRPEPKSATPAPTGTGGKAETPVPTLSPAPQVVQPAPRPPAKKRSLVPFAIAAVALLAIIGFFVLRPGGGAPTTGTVEIGGDLPPGTTVTAVATDGGRTEVDGATATLEAGSYTFEFSAPGYDASSSPVTVQAGAAVTWSPVVNATVVTASAGTLEVGAGLPDDATLTITLPDGTSRPLTDPTTQLEPGEYTVSFSAPGFEPSSESVVIEENGTTTYAPELTTVAPPAPTEGTLRIAANLPAGATVRLQTPNGQQRSVSPGAQLNLPPGRYTLQFSAPGFEDASGDVTITSNAAETWTPRLREVPAPPPQPQTGTLRIDRNALPAGANATITLRPQNGAPRNVTGSSLEVAPGSYTLEFTADGYRPFSSVVRITAGGSETWSPRIEALPAQPPDPGPTRDLAADRAAIESAVRDFVAAFNRRDADTVVPLLPAQQRDGWRSALTNTTDLTNFRASMAAIEPASLDDDQATVRFTVQVSYESRNAGQSASLPYIGTLRRNGDAWTLTSLQSAN